MKRNCDRPCELIQASSFKEVINFLKFCFYSSTFAYPSGEGFLFLRIGTMSNKCTQYMHGGGVIWRASLFCKLFIPYSVTQLHFLGWR
jgi:hypothetical protein